MSVMLNPGMTHRRYGWADWKEMKASLNGNVQFDARDDRYTVWFYDGPEIHLCEVWRGDIPDGDLQQAGDLSDFETNFKPGANKGVESLTSDGRKIVRVTTANLARNFKLRAITFRTSTLESQRSVNPLTDAPYGDVQLRLWNAQGAEITSLADVSTVVKTTVDFAPLYSYEIIGGWVKPSAALAGGQTDAWWISVVALPDYVGYSPSPSIDFVSEVNLEEVTGNVVSDGRATQVLPYTCVNGVNYRTNVIRFTIKHPPGEAQRFQVFLETFQ